VSTSEHCEQKSDNAFSAPADCVKGTRVKKCAVVYRCEK
jgi:hypothetical protein